MSVDILRDKVEYVYQTKPGSPIFRNEEAPLTLVPTPEEGRDEFLTLEDIRKALSPIAKRFAGSAGITQEITPSGRRLATEEVESGQIQVVEVIGYDDEGSVSLASSPPR